MLCYRDRTFCKYVECINDCERKLTDEIIKKAEKLGLPISQFARRPECYEGAEKC